MTALSDVPTAAALKVALDAVASALTAVAGGASITAIVITPTDGSPTISVPVIGLTQAIIDSFKTMLTTRKTSLTTQLSTLGVL